MIKRPLSAILGALMILTGIAAHAESDAPQLLDPVGVRMDSQPVVRGEIYEIEYYDAAVVTDLFEGYFSVDGTVKEVNCHIGSSVKKGDVLITLDEDELHDQIDALNKRIEYEKKIGEMDQQMAQLDIEIMEIERRRMIDEQADSQEILLLEEDIRAAQMKIEQQKDSLMLTIETLVKERALHEEKLNKNTIVSPYDGRVAYMKTIEADDRVTAYDKLVCVTDDSAIAISSAYISEMFFTSASRYYALINGREYDIEVEPVNWEENTLILLNGGELRSRFRILNPDEHVTVGMYAAICLRSKHVQDTLIIPKNALNIDGSGRYVYKMVDGARVRQTVRAGVSTKTQVEIIEGLEEGDEVYVKD